MTKFMGVIGYVKLVQTKPGVWVEQPFERRYFGDVLRTARRLEPSQQVNDNVTISNQLSILADGYAYEHILDMRYVVLWKQKWKITNVDVQRPRLLLTLGGKYNG